MKKSCTICGCSYGGVYAFKSGHICETCIKMLKSDIQANIHVRAENQF